MKNKEKKKSEPLKQLTKKEILALKKASDKRMKMVHGSWDSFRSHLMKWYFDLRPVYKMVKGKWVKTKKTRKVFNAGKMVGYQASVRVEAYAKKHKEIGVIHTDDDMFMGSRIALVPHPTMGITFINIPQCEVPANVFFTYDWHMKSMEKEIKRIKALVWKRR